MKTDNFDIVDAVMDASGVTDRDLKLLVLQQFITLNDRLKALPTDRQRPVLAALLALLALSTK